MSRGFNGQDAMNGMLIIEGGVNLCLKTVNTACAA